MSSLVKTRIALAMEHPLLQQGGTEVLIRELVRRLSEHFEIVLVTRDRSRQDLGEELASRLVAHLTWDRNTASRQTAHKLASALAESGAKLVHFHGGLYEWQGHKAWCSPLFYLANKGVPYLITNHLMHPLLVGYSDSRRPVWQKVLLLPKAWLSAALILARAQAVVLVSQHDLAQLRYLFPFLAGKFRHIYHSRLTRENGEPASLPREKTVLCLGAFGERKNQKGLLRAFLAVAPRHPGWTLHLVGPTEAPEYLEQVREMAAASGLAERIWISPPTKDPTRLLATTEILAIPSLVEGLPLSLQEALYYGAACAGSNIHGITELIKHESTGLLVPPGDEDALGEALDRLMSSPELRAQLTRKARQSIVDKGMLAEAMADNYRRLYEAILEGRSMLERK